MKRGRRVSSLAGQAPAVFTYGGLRSPEGIEARRTRERARARALRALKAAHPEEFRRLHEIELSRELGS